MMLRFFPLAILLGCAYPALPGVHGDDADAPPVTCGTTVCDPAPPAECTSSSTLRTFTVGCNEASLMCELTSTDTPCANGCADGACQGWASVSAGVRHACAVSTSGAVACWGENTF